MCSSGWRQTLQTPFLKESQSCNVKTRSVNSSKQFRKFGSLANGCGLKIIAGLSTANCRTLKFSSFRRITTSYFLFFRDVWWLSVKQVGLYVVCISRYIYPVLNPFSLCVTILRAYASIKVDLVACLLLIICNYLDVKENTCSSKCWLAESQIDNVLVNITQYLF